MTRNELIEALAYELGEWSVRGFPGPKLCREMAEDWADEIGPEEYEDPDFSLGRNVSSAAEERVRDRYFAEREWAMQARGEM